MIDLKFEGDIQCFHEKQIQFINEVLQKLGCESAVEVEPVGKAGDNYACDVRRIKSEINGKVLKMIVKVAPPNEILRAQAGIAKFFKNETIMYTNMLPKLAELQTKVDIPEKELYKFPKCYGCLTEQPHELILLEDLSERHYVMLDRFKPLTNEIVKLVLKKLAIFHALSYVLKHEELDTYNELNTHLSDPFDNSENEEMATQTFTSIENQMINIIESKYKKTMKGTLSRLIEFNKQLAKYTEDSKFSVIVHGDTWTNNILFQLQDKQAVNCVLIDYQLSKKSQPVIDIHYLIFSCTDFTTRQKHYYEWMDYYHATVGENLLMYNLDVKLVYPREQLNADLKNCAKFVFAFTALTSSLVLRKSEDAADLKVLDTVDVDKITETLKISHLDESTICRMKDRLEGLIESCYNFGYFT